MFLIKFLHFGPPQISDFEPFVCKRKKKDDAQEDKWTKLNKINGKNIKTGEIFLLIYLSNITKYEAVSLEFLSWCPSEINVFVLSTVMAQFDAKLLA